MILRTALPLLAAAAAFAQQIPVEGRPGSPVKVVIYEDLQCSDCAALRRMMDADLLPRFGAKVAFEHRDFPLPKHAWARKGAVAARFFADRDPKLALQFRSFLLENLRQINAANFERRLSAWAERHNVKSAEAVAALDEPRYAAAVEKDYQEGVARGVSKTPTVFVNGAPFIETFTVEEISKGIEQAIAETN
jgi:protein-disulfide isomerase